MSRPKESPRVTKAVLEWLESQFPNRLPEGPTTMTEIARLQGNQEVIAHLRSVQSRKR